MNHDKKESRLVFQVWISDKPRPALVKFSIERAMRYAARHGANYRLATRSVNDHAPQFGILQAYDQDYDKLFYLDCDAVIMDECPDIFQFHEFSAVADGDPGGKIAPLDYNQDVKDCFGIPREHLYFNSGVVLFTREFLDLTRKWVAENLPRHIDQKSQWDQSLLNEAVAKLGHGYHILNSDWNSWYRPKAAKFIQHYSAWFRDQFDEKALRRKMQRIPESLTAVKIPTTSKSWLPPMVEPAGRRYRNFISIRKDKISRRFQFQCGRQ